MLHHMTTILDSKWPPKYKNPPIWAKFGFQVDYDVANNIHRWFAMAAILNPKRPPKIQKSSDLGEIWFPSRL